MTKAIVDADIPIFTECAVAAARGNDFGAVYFPDIEALADAVCYTIDHWATHAHSGEVILVNSHQSRRNFRKHLLPLEYKAQRKVEKPAGYQEVQEIVLSRYETFTVDGIEGDDACGILHTSDVIGDTVTISTDKDFGTLPGKWFNPNKMSYPEMITPNAATHFWFQQVLEGDSADGYKGCRTIGKVKAKRILGDVDDSIDPIEYKGILWNHVLDSYISVYGEDEALDLAVMQARMARILHREDYNHEDNTIQLWHPTKPLTFDLASF